MGDTPKTSTWFSLAALFLRVYVTASENVEHVSVETLIEAFFKIFKYD